MMSGSQSVKEAQTLKTQEVSKKDKASIADRKREARHLREALDPQKGDERRRKNRECRARLYAKRKAEKAAAQNIAAASLSCSLTGQDAAAPARIKRKAEQPIREAEPCAKKTKINPAGPESVDNSFHGRKSGQISQNECSSSLNSSAIRPGSASILSRLSIFSPRGKSASGSSMISSLPPLSPAEDSETTESLSPYP